MPKYDLEWAIGKLSQLNPDQKINTMLMTAAIITKLLEKEQIRPIIVGGFSLAIYSNENYTTRDIDIVVSERNETTSLLQRLGFKKGNQNYFHEKLEVVIDFPGDTLAGSSEKVNKIVIDNTDSLYVYVIAIEDIIMDRLRAYLYWDEDISKEWGMQILTLHFDKLDMQYMMEVGKGAEVIEESKEITKWIDECQEIL